MHAESEKTTDMESKPQGNRYNRFEWAGAFGDLGTLIPFAVAYITIVKVPPFGLLFMFGVSLVAAGFYYRTPIPVQPMKAIGAAAISGGISPTILYGSGLTTGLFWLVVGLTGGLKPVSKLATKPVVRGIMLGLGISFMTDGIKRMKTAPILAGLALVVTFVLLTNPKVPVMFVLIVIGIAAAVIKDPNIISQFAAIDITFRMPVFTLPMISWHDLMMGTLLFTLPQIPLTLGNAVIAITAENNRLFPEHKTTENKMAVSQGIMNIVSPLFGGIPMCHGAGGMAGHVRFGAKTGGSLVILGCILLVSAFFFSDSVSLIFQTFPDAVLGVILFFAGSELAMSIRDIGERKQDVYVMIIVAGFAIWNMGVAFIAGVLLDAALKKGWLKI
jgi:hypothetical protein